MNAVPPEIVSSPVSILNVVVLPAPLTPVKKETISTVRNFVQQERLGLGPGAAPWWGLEGQSFQKLLNCTDTIMIQELLYRLHELTRFMEASISVNISA